MATLITSSLERISRVAYLSLKMGEEAGYPQEEGGVVIMRDGLIHVFLKQ